MSKPNGNRLVCGRYKCYGYKKLNNKGNVVCRVRKGTIKISDCETCNFFQDRIEWVNKNENK